MSAYGLIGSFVLFALVVTIHEFGHYIAARWWGDIPKKFAVGFGPALLKINYAGTEWSVRLIPLGGFISVERGDIKAIIEAGRFGRWIAYGVLGILAIVIILPCMGVVMLALLLLEGCTYLVRRGSQGTAWRRKKMKSWFDIGEEGNELNEAVAEEVPDEEKLPFDRHGWFAEFILAIGGPAANVITAFVALVLLYWLLDSLPLDAAGMKAISKVSGFLEIVWNIFVRMVTLEGFPQFNGPIEGMVQRAEVVSDQAIDLRTAIAIFAGFNLILGFLNLFPIPGLDGSHALCALLRAILPESWYREFRSAFFGLVLASMVSLILYLVLRDISFVGAFISAFF